MDLPLSTAGHAHGVVKITATFALVDPGTTEKASTARGADPTCGVRDA
ncbi:hypothetical protein [Rhodococcus sp. B10]|nr:hypothetical protein [Rhodococcus sp. B10]